MCHLLQKYQELNGSTRILRYGVWKALPSWKFSKKTKYNEGSLDDCCKEAIETIDPNFFVLQVSLILTYSVLFLIIIWSSFVQGRAAVNVHDKNFG